MDPFLKLARVPERPLRSDWLVAGILFVWFALEAIFVEGPGSTPVRILVALGFSLPLLFRRQAPFAALAWMGALLLFLSLVNDAGEGGTMPFPAMLVGTFSVALYERSRVLAIAGLAITATALPVTLVDQYFTGKPPGPTDVAIMTFFVIGAWSMGWLARRRAEQARRALAESDELARSAVAEERTRIARELHDVVAHSVSIIAVQAGAAEELIEKDPNAAREHLDSVRRISRDALTEMRRLLDVLREDEASYAPQPGLSRIEDLVAQAGTAGVEVELTEEGERPDLSPGLDLTVYRIVQEALTNVRKHAGKVPADVALRYGPQTLEVEVTNELNGASAAANGAGPESGGHGLLGMGERARLFNGTIDAGPENGRFRVLAKLPVEESAS